MGKTAVYRLCKDCGIGKKCQCDISWGPGGMMEEVTKQLLASLSDRPAERWGIRTAKDYLSGLAACLGDCSCALTHSKLATPDQWQKAIEEAAGRLCYSDDQTNVLAKSAHTLTPTPGAVLDFACVLTSTKEDRDGDILESAGAEIDEKMPLLWQHIPMSPIGTMKRLLSKSAQNVQVHFAIADTALGRDAATLVEFGALRMSHGFRPLDAAPRADAKSGWHIRKFACVEGSTVSIPANTDGVITSFSREKLHHPLVKSWAKQISDARPVTVTVPATPPSDCKGANTEHGNGHYVNKCSCGAVVSQCRCTSENKTVRVVCDNCSVCRGEKDAAKAGKCGCKCAACKNCGMKDTLAETVKAAVAEGLKVYTPIEGSWEWINEKLSATLSAYLLGKQLVGRDDYAYIDSMFPNAALVCVYGYPKKKCWRLNWKMEDGQPMWDGEPVEVQVVARMEEVAKRFGEAIFKDRLEAAKAADLLPALLRKQWTAGEAECALNLLKQTHLEAATREENELLAQLLGQTS